MKKTILILFLLLVMTFSVFAEKSRSTSNFEHGINFIYAGETLLAESFLPTAAVIALHSVFGVDLYKQVGPAVGLIALDLASITPLIVGLAVFSIGVSKYHSNQRHVAPRSQMSIYNRKIKMFDGLAIASAVISGIGACLLAPGIVISSLYYYDEMLIPAGISLCVVGGIAAGIFLPMLVSSIVMSTWLRGQKNRITPLVSLVRDEENETKVTGTTSLNLDNLLSNYKVKVGLKVSL